MRFKKAYLAALVAELLGTGTLTMMALAISRYLSKNAELADLRLGIPSQFFIAATAGLTFSAIVLLFWRVSGAHANPAVTIGLWTIRKVSTLRALGYIAAQILGAVLALLLHRYLIQSKVDLPAIKPDWHVFWAELIGTALFTLAFAAAIFEQYKGLRRAATIGLALFIGIMVAAFASNGLLNPAVALGGRSWGRAYIFGPIIGSVIGMNLYALLFAENRRVAANSAATKESAVSERAARKEKTTEESIEKSESVAKPARSRRAATASSKTKTTVRRKRSTRSRR